MDRFSYGCVRFFVRTVFILGTGFQVYGRENIPESGGAVIASNHQSFLDPVIVSAAAPRPLRYLARRTLFNNGAFEWLIRGLGALEVGGGGFRAAGMRRMVDVLAGGELVLMFPEGTRTHDGGLGDVKAGIGLIARRAGVPVVPAAIDGAYRIWPRQRKFPSPRRPLRVAFGEPVEAGGGKAVHGELKRRLSGLLEILKNKA